MKNPVDTVKGRIVDYDSRTGELVIRAYYPDWPIIFKREYKDCSIRLIDSRPLSDKQRKTCYVLLRDIARFTGQGLSSTKEEMKQKFLKEDLCETDIQHFSLSDAPVSMICAFQRYLVRFLLDYDIPSSIPLLDFVDDIQDYIYACIVHQKCCVCGRAAELHHVDHVGAGRDREEIVHAGMEVLPLCRRHHTEAHDIGKLTFNEKYHISGGIILDEKLCDICGLKAKEEETG